MIWGISRQEIKLAFRGVHYHIKKQGEELMATIAEVKASADAAVAQLDTLEAKLKDVSQKLADAIAAAANAPAPVDNSADLQAIKDALDAAVARDQ